MLVLPFARGAQMKLRRQHADDRVNDIVQRQRLAEHVALAAEMAAEKGVRQHRDVSLRRIGRRRVETRAERGFHPEKSEEIRRSSRALNPFRLWPARQVEVCVFKSADRLELGGLPGPLEKIRVS